MGNAKIKKKPLMASLIVTQANELVEARYNLTLGEQRFIFTMISRIQPDDPILHRNKKNRDDKDRSIP